MPIGTPVGGVMAELASAGTSLNVAYPASPSALDFLLLWVATTSSNPPGVPAGWNDLVSGQSGTGAQSPGQRLSYKFAAGGESGSVASTFASGTGRGRMWKISGVDPNNPLDTPAVYSIFGAVTSYTVPGISPVTAGALLMLFSMANTASGIWTPPTTQGGGWVEDVDDNAPSPHGGVHYLQDDTPGATGNINLVRSTGTRGGVATIALRPALPAVDQSKFFQFL